MAADDRSLMFVLAHPDDETFGPGGTIAKYTRDGVRVSVITATSGQAGRSGGLASTPEELGRVREAEARAAAQRLGISGIHFLRYMDGQLDQASEQEVKEKVVRLLREQRPDVVVTFGPEGAGNEHRDHKFISRIATKALSAAGDRNQFSDQIKTGLAPHLAKKFYYMSGRQVPWRQMTSSFMPVTTSIDISDFVDAKIEAFKLHHSQQQFLPLLLDWMRANGNFELYHRAASLTGRLPQMETDLFTGLD